MRCIAGSSSSSSPVYRLNKYDKVMRSGNCLSEINSGNSFKRDFHELTYIVGGSKLATLYNRTSKRKAESIRDDEIDLYIKVIAKISFLSKNRGQKFIVGYIKSENDYFKDTKFSKHNLIHYKALFTHLLIYFSIDSKIDFNYCYQRERDKYAPGNYIFRGNCWFGSVPYIYSMVVDRHSLKLGGNG